jgi:hypothetical protein
MSEFDEALAKMADGHRTPASIELEKALDTVRAAGYVAIKSKSYHRAQERQRVAEVRAECETAAAEHARQWAGKCLDEQNRLAARLTFVYGMALMHGATVEALRGEAGS